MIAVAGAIFVVSACSCSGSAKKEPDTRVESPSSKKIANGNWNPRLAQAYLDERENWWMSWSRATRDQGTFCVACHTTVPYILAEPALRARLDEPEMSRTEEAVLENITKRVRMWDRVQPYYGSAEYGGQKGKESRSTEAVLNALLLASRDSESGKLGDDTQAAFKNMWSLQLTDGPDRGAWLWQQFWLRPWESRSAVYSGASWAALAVGLAPEGYQDRSEIRGNLTLLYGYLTQDFSRRSALNQAYLLWASTKLNGLLTPKQRQQIIDEIFRKQQQDGGWTLSTITWSWEHPGLTSLVQLWRREDWTPQEKISDGLATGLMVFALQEAGVNKSEPRVEKGLDWLVANQDKKSGMWVAASLNKQRDPTSNVGLFMSDAATAFAVLALTQDGSHTAFQRTAISQ